MQTPTTALRKAEHTFTNSNTVEEETGNPWGLLASQSRQISELQVLVIDPDSKKDGGEGLEKASGMHTLVHYISTTHMHTMEHNALLWG